MSRIAPFVHYGLAAFLIALLAACVPIQKQAAPSPVTPPANYLQQVYLKAVHRGLPVYRIDPAASLVTIYVHRAGALAAFGHDHIVASHDVHGYALISDHLADSRTDLYFPVETLQVDETELLRKAGFTEEINAKDIEGTREHMLNNVLESEKYPYVQVKTIAVSGTQSRIRLSVDLTVHGVTRTLQIPVDIKTTGKELDAQGEFDIRQTDFGMTPYSILGGALAVKDNLHIVFRLHGERESD